MSAILTPEIPTTRQESEPALAVMMVYEDTWAGLRARQALEGLPRSSEGDRAYRLRLWRWELLCDPLLKERAVEDARNADVILISAHSRCQLPKIVGDWLARWLARRQPRPYALGLLVDGDTHNEVPGGKTCRFVQCLAKTRSADFYGWADQSFEVPDQIQARQFARGASTPCIPELIIRKATQL